MQLHVQAIPQPCKNKCLEYDRLLIDYNLLKENYERLIAINKKHQDQNKDKELAQNIQMEELRNGFAGSQKDWHRGTSGAKEGFSSIGRFG